VTRLRDSQGRFVKAITAAASVIPTEQLDRLPRTIERWQEQAWRLWRILGVLHYPTSFKAKQVGRLKWNVEVDGNLLEPEQAEETIKAVTQPLSIGEAARRIALNLEVAGEVWYARAKDEWNVYAATTPKLQEKLKTADIVVRGWNPDPVEPDKPSSTVQAALGTAEQIRLMVAMSRNQDRNRLAQRGILLVPKEGQFPEGDDFQANLETSMTAPIGDEYSPSAVVPLKVEFPGEWIEKWRHLVLESPYDDKLMDRIDKAVHQFALELDMPPEMLLGNIDSNHWNAWLSDESNYRGHVEPLGFLVGDVFARAMMAAVEGKSIVVTPDPSELLARRQSVADAFEALRLAVVGFDYVRAQIGADEDDKPSDEEIALILQVTGNTSRVEVPSVGTGQTEAGPPELNGNGQVTAAVEDQSEAALDRLGRQLLALDMQLLGTLRGEARMAVEMAREKHEDGIGVQQRIASEMKRLGRAWRRDVADAHSALRELGITAKGQEWDIAADASVGMLVDGMTQFVTDNLNKTDDEMPALPTTLLREVMAAAGGSNTATVAAVSPTFADPQGFAIGVLSLKDLKTDGIALTQWRFRRGPLTRENPFDPHVAIDGQFLTAAGLSSEGFYPGDHQGCLCAAEPIFRRTSKPAEVGEF
jgi:hypothetical protein